jgi:hypothetical protein
MQRAFSIGRASNGCQEKGRQNLLRGGTEKSFKAGEKIVSNLKMPK